MIASREELTLELTSTAVMLVLYVQMIQPNTEQSIQEQYRDATGDTTRPVKEWNRFCIVEEDDKTTNIDETMTTRSRTISLTFCRLLSVPARTVPSLVQSYFQVPATGFERPVTDGLQTRNTGTSPVYSYKYRNLKHSLP